MTLIPSKGHIWGSLWCSFHLKVVYGALYDTRSIERFNQSKSVQWEHTEVYSIINTSHTSNQIISIFMDGWIRKQVYKSKVSYSQLLVKCKQLNVVLVSVKILYRRHQHSLAHIPKIMRMITHAISPNSPSGSVHPTLQSLELTHSSHLRQSSGQSTIRIFVG